MNGVDVDDGVPDMTVISDIDEHGINKNLQKRYKKNKIYVSIFKYIIGLFNPNLYTKNPKKEKL